MARTYRTIKFIYNSLTFEIDVPIESEDPTIRDIETIQTMISGAVRRDITGQSSRWVYSFERCDTDIYNFFNDAYTFSIGGGSVVLSLENDDTTFTDYNVIVRRPVYKDDTITTVTGQKVYLNLSCEVLKA